MDVSGISGVESAGERPPSPMPGPAMDPSPPIAGQPLVGVTNLAEERSRWSRKARRATSRRSAPP